MGSYAAIADVGWTVVTLLRNEMAGPGGLVDSDEIALVSPGDMESNDDYRLTLFLYRVVESAHLKNAARQSADTDTQEPPPLALDLYYLLTAHRARSGPQATGTRDQHTVLGRAMQVLYDHSILDGDELTGSLVADDAVHLSIDASERTDVVNIWNTFTERPYQPSVSYVVSPVFVETTREESIQRVVEKEERYRVY